MLRNLSCCARNTDLWYPLLPTSHAPSGFAGADFHGRIDLAPPHELFLRDGVEVECLVERHRIEGQKTKTMRSTITTMASTVPIPMYITYLPVVVTNHRFVPAGEEAETPTIQGAARRTANHPWTRVTSGAAVSWRQASGSASPLSWLSVATRRRQEILAGVDTVSVDVDAMDGYLIVLEGVRDLDRGAQKPSTADPLRGPQGARAGCARHGAGCR